MIEKSMTLNDAISFNQKNHANLFKFGFSVTYRIETPTDENNEPAFGFFHGVIKRGDHCFSCDVDGEFKVVNADRVLVIIESSL